MTIRLLQGSAIGLLTLLLGSCAAALPELTDGSERVVIRKGDPPPGHVEVGPVSVSHGSGCGLFGSRGSYDGALTLMKNQAATLRADYVRLDMASEPHFASGCAVNEFTLRGVAFRSAPPPRPAVPPSVQVSTLQSLGQYVGQPVVLHLKSGEVLAGTLAALSPPDDVQFVLLDQSSRHIKLADIGRVVPRSTS